ncbi:MAG TPA: GNAT family N-acetyltransferase [Candidatus Binatia bacterium]|nr:GNAT family N-acetyltransferase [Candidatus Binatia bacterium]
MGDRTPPPLAVEPLTPDRWPDLVRLFSAGGDPKWCWCAWWRLPSSEWRLTDPARNQAVLRAAVEGGPPPGLLGYLDGEPVGWVSLGPREAFPRLERSKLLARLDERPVWSIVCFVVARTHRRRGVARALLRAAIDHARRSGATCLEAYPVDPGEGRLPAASAYTGTVRLFEGEGFVPVAERRWSPTSPRRRIVRLEL